MIKYRLLIHIYSFIAKHPMPATMVFSSSVLWVNYNTVKRFREKNLCAPLVYRHSINTIGQTDDWVLHIHEIQVYNLLLEQTMTYKSDYQKVKFNCMSFQTEMLKEIYTFFTDHGWFLKILKNVNNAEEEHWK